MASVLITYLNIENRLDRQYDYDDGQSVLTYILVFSLICQKLTRLITQAQSYALRVLYDTYNLRLFWSFCFSGTTDQTSSAFVRILSQVNEKPMIIIIISVCSQMITYKAMKANSWLRY